jgi:DNA-binding transcriptional MocR family regulator
MTITWTPQLRNDDNPLYYAIAKAIEEDISTGRLPEGSHLPTHRELALRMGIAIGTVTRAYRVAEQMGLIHGEGRRGTIVGNQTAGKASFSRLIDSVRTVHDTDCCLPFGVDLTDLSSTLRTIAELPNLPGFLQYEKQSDLLTYQEAGSTWFSNLGLSVPAESLVLTWGAHHGMMLALATAVSHGDTIAAEELAYSGLLPIAHFLGLKVIGITIDQEGITPEAFEAACKRDNPRALVCNPTVQNPTNATMTKARRLEILSIAERFDVAII